MSTIPDTPAATGQWIPLAQRLPTDGELVLTKIDDGSPRNVQNLKRNGRLWFLPDGSMYVYYTPTHWLDRTAGAQ